MSLLTNDVKRQSQMSYDGNNIVIRIDEDKVNFSSEKNLIDLNGTKLSGASFSGELSVDELTIDGEKSLAFTQDFKDKLDSLQTPMQVKGSVRTKEELPIDAKVGDVWLVGEPDSEEFEEFVCVAVEDLVPRWESLGMASTTVSYSPAIPVGTTLGVITIDGVSKTIYAPVINDANINIKVNDYQTSHFTTNQVDDEDVNIVTAYRTRATTGPEVHINKEYMNLIDTNDFTKIVCTASAAGFCHEWAFRIKEAPASIAVEMSSGDAIKWGEEVDLANLEVGATYVGSVIGDPQIGYFGTIKKF